MAAPATRPDDRRGVDQRREDAHPPVVGGGHQHAEHDADRDVDQLLLEERLLVAAGEGVAVGVADQTSRAPSASSAPVASARGQSSRRHPGERRILPSRTRTAREQVMAWLPAWSRDFFGSLDGSTGGRISPSSANTGSLTGGITPGIGCVGGPDVGAVHAVQRLVDLAHSGSRRAGAGAGLGDHHHHDVVLGVRRDPRGALLAVTSAEPVLARICTLSSGKSMNRQAIVPVFGVPSRALSMYWSVAFDALMCRCTRGLEPLDHVAVGVDDRLRDTRVRTGCRRSRSRRTHARAAAG